MREKEHIGLDITYKKWRTIPEQEQRVRSFLETCSLPVSHAYLKENDDSNRVLLIWDYDLHENLMAWNFGHTLQEVVFRRNWVAYLELASDAGVSLLITEDIPEFSRFGAAFLRQGISLEHMDANQWAHYTERVDDAQISLRTRGHLEVYQETMMQDLMRSKLALSMRLIETVQVTEELLATLFSLYDAASALHIALDFRISPSIGKQYQILENYLSANFR